MVTSVVLMRIATLVAGIDLQVILRSSPIRPAQRQPTWFEVRLHSTRYQLPVCSVNSVVIVGRRSTIMVRTIGLALSP